MRRANFFPFFPSFLRWRDVVFMLHRYFQCLSVFRSISASPTWSTRPTTGSGARSTSLWVHRNLFWQSSRDRNWQGSHMSRITKASPKPSFRAPWRVGDAVVSRGNAGWTTSQSGHPCPCQNCSQGPPAEKA